MAYANGNVVQVQQSYPEEHGHTDMIVTAGNADFTSLIAMIRAVLVACLLPGRVIDFILPALKDIYSVLDDDS